MRRWVLVALALILAAGCNLDPAPGEPPTPLADADDPTGPGDDDSAQDDDDSSQDDDDSTLDDDDSADGEDRDGDGYSVPEDCDDDDPLRFPGALEYCNGIDDSCDGVIPARESDADGDGHPACDDCDDNDPTSPFGPPVDLDLDGWDNCEDCDDSDPDTYPGAPGELCAGGDTDCDGVESATVTTGAQPAGTTLLTTADAWTSFQDDTGTVTYFGHNARFAGDLTGDGLEDIVISGTSGTSAFVFAGPFCNGVIRLSDAAYELDIQGEPGVADHRLEALGDITGDGFDDFRGGRCVFFGPITSDRDCATSDLWLSAGTGVDTTTGDFNGDGIVDLAVADWYGGLQTAAAGLVHLHWGPFVSGEVLTHLNADSVLEAVSPASFGAAAVATIAGPGAADGLAVLTLNDRTSPGELSTGVLDFWMPPFPGYSPLDQGLGRVTDLNPPPGPGAPMGAAGLAALGDLDGDGGTDLFVAAATGGTTPSPVSWYFPSPVPGTVDASVAGWPVTLVIPGFALGFDYAASGGDSDGDGTQEWVGGNANAGGASGVHEGPALGPVDSTGFTWSVQYQTTTVDAGTDVDGDGLDDMLLGNGIMGDWAWLFLGGTAGP